MAAQRNGDLNKAVTGYEQVLKLVPNLLPARANLAAAEVQLGRLEDGISNYRVALRLSRGNPQIALLLGDALVSAHRYNEAIALLQPLEKAHPHNLDLAFLLGVALIDKGQRTQGLQRIERVARSRNDENAWTLAAVTRLKMDDYAKAEASAETAIRLNPSDPGAYVLSGMAKAALGNTDGAKTAYRKALDLNSDDFDANLRLGTLLRIDGDTQGAKPYLEHALRLNPASLSARFEVARMEISDGRDAEAVANLEEIVRRDPDLPQPHVRLAVLYVRMHRQRDSDRERQIVDRLQGMHQKREVEDFIDNLERTGVNPSTAAR
jgi:tetratricopeptide (TPR) repeat protein